MAKGKTQPTQPALVRQAHPRLQFADRFFLQDHAGADSSKRTPDSDSHSN